jgi:hypothetical protein
VARATFNFDGYCSLFLVWASILRIGLIQFIIFRIELLLFHYKISTLDKLIVRIVLSDSIQVLSLVLLRWLLLS